MKAIYYKLLRVYSGLYRYHDFYRLELEEEAGSGQQAARLCPCARAGGVLEAICVQWTEN